jgi:starvation-inducible DNA-binding protein
MCNALHNTKISLPEKQRVELIAMLNVTMGSMTDLYLQLKNAHWNVKGMQFAALHQLFDELAEKSEPQIDDLAERVTALGGTALGDLKTITAGTQLKAYPAGLCEAKLVVEHLAHNFAILGEHARNNICEAEKHGDIATGDIYIGLVRFLDKNLWFLEAHLQK